MNKVFQLLMTSLFMIYMSLFLPLQANTTEPSTPIEAIQGFTIEHRVNDANPLPAKRIEAEPLILLQTLRQDILAQLAKHSKPLKIHTKINVLMPKEMANTWKKLPALLVETHVNKSGNGKSEFAMPAYRHEEPSNRFVVNWKGLNGELTFTESFENLSIALSIAGLSLEGGEGFLFSFDKFHYNGMLDADLIPNQMDFSLPKFKMGNNDSQLKGYDIVFKMKVNKTNNGVDLATGLFKMGYLGFDAAETRATLDDLEFTFDSNEQGDLVNFLVDTKIGNLVLPKEILGESIKVSSYTSNMEIRRLDSTAIKIMQNAIRALQKQRQSGALSEEMMNVALLGNLIQVVPFLLMKSPEVALTQLNLKTKEGGLEGNATIAIDGRKVRSLEPMALLGALQGQGEFGIDKTLVKKVFASNAQLIKGLLEQKVLVTEGGDKYKLIVKLQDNKLTVNGKLLREQLAALQAKSEQQRQAELERQRQAELERQRQAELERQRQAELERQRQDQLPGCPYDSVSTVKSVRDKLSKRANQLFYNPLNFNAALNLEVALGRANQITGRCVTARSILDGAKLQAEHAKKKREFHMEQYRKSMESINSIMQ